MTLEPKTPRGKASRERILAAAAERIHLHGVHGTHVDEILQDSGTGKSQLYHYFGSKEDLVRSVVAYQADRILREQEPHLRHLDSWDGIEAWLDAIVAYHRDRGCAGGCPIGSLAAEMADESPRLATDLTAVFQVWQDRLAAGLEAMRRRGELRREADPASLAAFVVAAQQGGILLASASKHLGALETALEHALAHLRSFAAQAPSAPRASC